MTERSIPSEILASGSSKRLEYFRTKVVPHHEWQIAKDELASRIRRAGRDQLIFLYGATGSGKSTVCRSIVEDIYEEHREELMVNKSRLPALYGELDSPTGSITWIDVYDTLLHAGCEPLIDFKIAEPSPELDFAFPSGERPAARKYLRSYMSMIDHRAMMVSIIDNANFLATMRTRQQDRILLPLITMCRGVPHVVAGTSPLIMLRNITGQVTRRSHPGPVHLRRYQLGNGKDEQHFAEAVEGLADVLPVPDRPDLSRHYEFLFTSSLGCIGLLKDWLYDALELSIREKSKTIKKQHLIDTEMGPEERSELEAEALDGESTLQNRKKRSKLDQPEEKSNAPTESDKADENQKRVVQKNSMRRRRKAKPGKRKPKRDTVGVEAVLSQFA